MWFSFSLDQHNYETSSSRQGANLKKTLLYAIDRTRNRYGKYSIITSATDSWNKITQAVAYLKIPSLLVS